MFSLDNVELVDRMKDCGTKASPGESGRLFRDNSAKALVMNYVGQMVADGLAEWDTLCSGDILVRFRTGDTFLFGETTIARL